MKILAVPQCIFTCNSFVLWTCLKFIPKKKLLKKSICQCYCDNVCAFVSYSDCKWQWKYLMWKHTLIACTVCIIHTYNEYIFTEKKHSIWTIYLVSASLRLYVFFTWKLCYLFHHHTKKFKRYSWNTQKNMFPWVISCRYTRAWMFNYILLFILHVAFIFLQNK